MITVNRGRSNSGKVQHFFHLNTDFEYIFTNINSRKVVIFLVIIYQMQNYKNSSFLNHGESHTYFHENTSIRKRKDWPLHYKSCIVAPICPGIAEQRNTSTLVGFLCIDSEYENIFDESIDPKLFVDALMGFIIRLNFILRNLF